MFLAMCSQGTAQTKSALRSIPEDPEIPAALGVIEARLSSILQDKGIPGMSAAVIYDQQVIWSKGLWLCRSGGEDSRIAPDDLSLRLDYQTLYCDDAYATSRRRKSQP